MSSINRIEQNITSVQTNHEGDVKKTVKKIGPVVPPKPKKSQPEVPQSYTLKNAAAPSYSTVLNNIVTNEKSTNLFTPAPYIPQNLSIEKNNTLRKSPTNGTSSMKFCHNEENIYTNQPQEKFQPKYGYDEKSFYSNVNVPISQTSTDDESNRLAKSAIYSNSDTHETATPASIPAPVKKEKDLIYSNIQWNAKPENMYSNIPGAYHHEDLPLPPEPSEYISCSASNSFPPPPEELPPPPSPVSSSYSELRRATDPIDFPSENYQNDIYGPSSQSSNYESIYEPINPRPPSQLSCNYSSYFGYDSTLPSQGKMSPVKEVDALTDLLVQGMTVGNDDGDIYGICAQCGRKVEGEGNGCSAMDKVFHITCFCCFVCQVNLQGKPFYSLEGKPYCEEDYLNTLEKCCVCTRPILDRILRATGKPYHPSCFMCVVCGESLDGIPFTVDATNQIHCIQCFHKKFAPRCCVCKLPIMPEADQNETVRVVALDRSFHIHCYKCEDCGLILSSDSEGRGCYPLDNHILCKACNAARVQALTSHMTTEL